MGTVFRFFRWAALTVAMALAAGPGLAADGVVKAPAPAWIDTLAVPAPSPARARRVEDGVHYLLSDMQARAEPASETVYRRIVSRITDRSGLEDAGRIDIEFDPSQDELALHHLRVTRDGKVMDRLPTTRIEVLRRETDLENGVVTGAKTAHIELNDIRVGDVLDYSYSWRTRPGTRVTFFAGGATTLWSTPVEMTRYRLMWREGRPLTIKSAAAAPKPTITRDGAWRIYDWRSTADPVDTEKGTPDWFDEYARISVSSMGSWADVAAWALPLYAGKDALPPDLAARVDAIARATPDVAGRITQAIRLVQDDIRYVSLSIADGAYTPRSPAAVMQSGYGDCKDKSQLLAAVLRRLGVEAYVALTDMDAGPGLQARAPSPNAFDHAIVQIRLGGKSYWVDPTSSHQGGRFPNLPGLPYGFALPIAAAQNRLEPVTRIGPAAPMTEVAERYVLSSATQPALELTVSTAYRGTDADAFRGDIAGGSPAQLERRYADYYAELYPGLTVARPLDIRDDRDANLIEVKEAYRLSAAALAKDGLSASFPVRFSESSYKQPEAGVRRTPLLLSYPHHMIQKITLVTPGHKPPAPSHLDFKGAGFDYDRSVTRKGETLEIVHILAGTKEVLAAGEVAAFAKDLDTLADAKGSDLDLTSKRGGVIGAEDKLMRWVLAIAGGLAVAAALAFAVEHTRRHDAAYRGQARYYPISILKFCLLNLATVGVYAAVWMWKCWRWAKFHGDQPLIMPFWRAVFGGFWLYPLFSKANRRLGARAVPVGLGAAAAIAYIVWPAAGSIAERLKVAPLLQTSIMASFICVLPCLIAVNRQNADSPTALAANSRFNVPTLVALGLGVLLWVLMAIGMIYGDG